MITDQTCTYLKKTSAKNSKGQVANTYASTGTFLANVQPLGLNSATIAQWGGLDLSANARVMYTFKSNCTMLDRVQDQYGGLYEIRGVNPWGSPPFGHWEYLLIPVQGEVLP